MARARCSSYKLIGNNRHRQQCHRKAGASAQPIWCRTASQWHQMRTIEIECAFLGWWWSRVAALSAQCWRNNVYHRTQPIQFHFTARTLSHPLRIYRRRTTSIRYIGRIKKLFNLGDFEVRCFFIKYKGKHEPLTPSNAKPNEFRWMAKTATALYVKWTRTKSAIVRNDK